MAKDDYKVGISTGFWRIGKDPNLLGLAQKVGGLGATGGIRFVQIDLETIAEFYEPEVKEQIKRMRDKLGMIAGLHGEIGQLMAMDSAEKTIWEQTHRRLCQTVKFAHELGFFYVNIHFSNKQLISFTEAQHRTQGYFYPVVDPYGKGLQNIVVGNKKIYDEASRHVGRRIVDGTKKFNEEAQKLLEKRRKEIPKLVNQAVEREIRNSPRELTKEEKEGIRNDAERTITETIQRQVSRTIQEQEFIFNVWLNFGEDDYERYILEDGEFGAFHIVANWMKATGDSLWENIAEGKDPMNMYLNHEVTFAAAVSSKYIEGHLTLKDHQANKDFLEGMSIKEWCEKKKLYLLIENPESGEGMEGLYRLYHPKHFYHLIKKINSPFVKICIDFEHMVSQQLDPDKIFKELPDDFGKLITLFHVGKPVPYGGVSHIPVARGTLEQEQLYRWIYWMKKKGFKNGYIMFERGGGRSGSGRTPFEVFEDSVAALRQIKKYLEMDVKPEDLPPEFYGISSDNKGLFTKQVVSIREHAWDPLEGVLTIPEEKHTFLSGAAVQKQKAQEWEKRKFR